MNWTPLRFERGKCIGRVGFAKPLMRHKKTHFVVCGDVFEKRVPDSVLAALLSIMASADMHGHTFELETSRLERVKRVKAEIRWAVALGFAAFAPRCLLVHMASIGEAQWRALSGGSKMQPGKSRFKMPPNVKIKVVRP